MGSERRAYQRRIDNNIATATRMITITTMLTIARARSKANRRVSRGAAAIRFRGYGSSGHRRGERLGGYFDGDFRLIARGYGVLASK